MNISEINTTPQNATMKTVAKAPKNLRRLAKMLQEPLSVRQLHRRAKAQEKRLRAALSHQKDGSIIVLHEGGQLQRGMGE